ncbi:c-type cytochrome [Seohaeicola nanhaiensis]|uniref:C-type cytochrome n=1 Tax=Seohaeicola nanhaiensis TaxID=1387282 RepID=A0ABV9KLR4_9RHOB
MNSIKLYLILAGTVILGVSAYFSFGPTPPPRSAQVLTEAEFVMPQLSSEAQEGERYFNAVCATCHGQNGLGTDQGPPLIHDIYNPGHHADQAFMIAAMNGVRQHHWPFGNMPPQKVTSGEVARIITYVRELQEANGITYRPHKM